jgi:hypothetical protein
VQAALSTVTLRQSEHTSESSEAPVNHRVAQHYPFGPEDNARNYVLVRYATGFGDVAKGVRTAALSIDSADRGSCGATRKGDALPTSRKPVGTPLLFLCPRAAWLPLRACRSPAANLGDPQTKHSLAMQQSVTTKEKTALIEISISATRYLSSTSRGRS